jgi:hypothetical protein
MRGVRPPRGPSPSPRVVVAALVTSVVALVPLRARAYRPFDGTDAEIVEPGEFELELGPTHLYRANGRNYLIAPGGVLNLGLLSRLEAVVDFKNFVALGNLGNGEPRDQLAEVDLLAKVILRRGAFQGDTGPSLALEAGLLLPATSSSEDTGAQANLILSLADERLAAHLNQSVSDNREHRLEVFSSAIVEVGRRLPVRPVLEIFVDHTVDVATVYSALVGAIWPWREQLVFDLAGRAAYQAGAPAWELRLGLTWTTRVWPSPRASPENQGR